MFLVDFDLLYKLVHFLHRNIVKLSINWAKYGLTCERNEQT